MISPVYQQPSRRDVLNTGLFLGAAAALTGCQTASHGVATLPKPVWPDNDPRVGSTPIQPPTIYPPTVPSLPTGVITRTAWTSAKPNMAYSKPMNGVQRITVHHSANNNSTIQTKADAARALEGIRQAHTSRVDASIQKNWIDIGYHYIIDPAGRIWEGRPVAIEGAHVKETNQHNLGIMVMGNFDEQQPTMAALSALDNFVASEMRRYRVPLRNVFTHQELKSTACPGTYLQRYMVATRTLSGRMAQGSL